MISAEAVAPKTRVDTSVPVVVVCPGYHGHGIARSLGRLGILVYGVHSDPRSPAARSRYWRENFIWDLSKAPVQESITWLLNLGRRIGSRPLLIATDDDSCLLVTDYADTLREVFRFPNQPAGLTRSLSSKKEMYYLCKRFGLPAAETSFPQSRGDVVAFSETARFPVLLKGIDTLAVQRRTGVKMVVAPDGKALLKYYDEMESHEAPSLMLQEYLPGGSQTVWMFNGYFDDRSDCLFGHTGKKIREYPPYTGRTSLGVCLANETVARQTKAFMKAIGYRGALDLGYKYDEQTGQYKTIDINPRVGATFRLFVDTAGMDVVRALYLDMTGQPVVPGVLHDGRKWVVENFDAVTVPTYRRKEGLSTLGWLASYRGVEEASWFARDDPAPFFAMGWSSLRSTIGGRFNKGSHSTHGSPATQSGNAPGA